ncbi:MAG: zf-HC2 domain-containing protein [Candidatus Aminicenantaceae bacterium]|jgi:hypothetical protein
MSCPTERQIYLYLEDELPVDERESIEKHISFCVPCKILLEDRKMMMQAVETLPPLDMPADFTQQVMAKVFPRVSSVRIWVAGSATAFSLMMFIFLAIYLQSDISFSGVFVRLNSSLWAFVKNLSVFVVKLFKIASVIFEILIQFASFVLKTLASLATLIRPEFQIILITLTVVLSISLLYMMRRKIWTGDKI